MQKITISQLWTYPIKSLPGIALDTVELDDKGFKLDRQWMLVDLQGVFITQRKFPQLARFQISLVEFGIKLSYPEMPVLIIPFVGSDNKSYELKEVRVWKDICTAYHLNSVIDNWFSECIGYSCQLVYLPDDSKRKVDADYATSNELTRFTDGFPLLLISEASLADLNNRLEKPVDMRHFRPNIVVQGCDSYTEDNWKQFKVNKISFSVVKPCSRCIVTTIDPDLGIRTDREPLDTLKSYRQKNNKVYFGQNLLLRFPQQSSYDSISIGDSLVFSEKLL